MWLVGNDTLRYKVVRRCWPFIPCLDDMRLAATCQLHCTAAAAAADDDDNDYNEDEGR